VSGGVRTLTSPGENVYLDGGFFDYYGIQGGTTSYGNDEATTGNLLGDWMYPEIDIFGFTMTGFNSPMDATLSAEIAFIPNKPYNYVSIYSDLPGWNGVIDRDTVTIMYRIDTASTSMDALVTHSPVFSDMTLGYCLTTIKTK